MTVSKQHAATRSPVRLADGRIATLLYVTDNHARVFVSGRREKFPLDDVSPVAPSLADLITSLRRIASSPATVPPDVIRRTALAALDALTKEHTG